MNTTFTLEVQKKPIGAGKFPVFIRITRDKKHRRIKATVTLDHYTDWNKNKKEVRQSEPNYSIWNAQLKKELEEVQQFYRDHLDLSLDELASQYKRRWNSDSFLDFARLKVEEEYGAKMAVNTYLQYKSTLAMLESYLKAEKRKDLLFNEVTLDFLTGYESFLYTVENRRIAGRKLEKSTIDTHLKKLKVLVKMAKKTNDYLQKNDPFILFEKRQSKTSKKDSKEKLTVEELSSIMSLELERGCAEWHTRNAFLFSFYCAGIRVGDLLQLRWGDIKDGRLVYTMGKNGKERNLELIEDAKRILELYRSQDAQETDYIFPFLDSGAMWAIKSAENYDTMPDYMKKALYRQVSSKTTLFNMRLKKIAELAGIKKNLSSHVARHTFASLAREKNIAPSMIQGLLAHSDLATTQIYMGHFGDKEQDEALEKVAGSVTGKKASESPKEALISALKGLDKETLAEVLESLRITE